MKTTEPTGAEPLLPSPEEHNHTREAAQAAKLYPAITIPVRITAEEHARIAAFCGRARITVSEYVTFAGIGVDVDDYEKDPTNRAALVEDIAKRFGGSWLSADDTTPRTVSVNFSAEAFAMLEFLRIHDGHDSAESWIRHGVADGALSLFEFITHVKEGERNLRTEFCVCEEGGEA